MLALATWLTWTIAAAMFLVIAFVGLSFLRGIVAGGPRVSTEPEDVADLGGFFVVTGRGWRATIMND